MADVAMSGWPWFVPPSVLTIAILALLHLWHENSHKARLGNKMPGPSTIPLLGNIQVLLGLRNSEHIFKRGLKLSRAYGNVIRGWVGWRLIVFLHDPRDVEVILNSQNHIEKSEEYRFFKPWLGNGLLISTGDKWRLHRKLIAPAFHMNILKSFVGIFNENSRRVVEKLRKDVGKEIDVHDHMSEATVDILLETAMGFKSPKEETKGGFKYAMAVMRMCDILHQRQVLFFYRVNAIFNLSKFKKIQEEALDIIHGLTSQVLKGKKEIFIKNFQQGILPKPSLQEIVQSTNSKKVSSKASGGLRDDLDDIDENDVGEKRRLAFLDLMIETSHYNPNQLSDEEIKQQVDTIMFEGHDTTAAGSSFVLCMLGVHQEIQKKVFEEQKSIFANSTRDVTFADTIEMKFLERVIMESLRLYPPVPIIARKVNEDVKLSSGNYTIPKGTTVVLNIFNLHRDAAHYENPVKFNPDNFLPENMQNRHYYSYVPFSAGPRSCVGRKYAMLKLKCLLSTIIRNFHVTSTVPEKDFKLQADIILKRSDGFRIRLEPRTVMALK